MEINFIILYISDIVSGAVALEQAVVQEYTGCIKHNTCPKY